MKRLALLAIVVMAAMSSCKKEKDWSPYDDSKEQVWLAVPSYNAGLDTVYAFVGRLTSGNTIDLKDLAGNPVSVIKMWSDWQTPVTFSASDRNYCKAFVQVQYRGRIIKAINASQSFISVPDAKSLGQYNPLVGIYYDLRSNTIFEASTRQDNESGFIQLDSLKCGTSTTLFGNNLFERCLPGQDPKGPHDLDGIAQVKKDSLGYLLINGYGQERIQKIL